MRVWIISLILLVVLLLSGCIEELDDTKETTTTIKPQECNDDFDCRSQMKCDNYVCVNVGCVDEGGIIPSMSINPDNREHMATECCEDLTMIEYSENYDENCDFKVLVGGPVGACTRCGNGQCEEQETKCNCPEDCFSQ